MTLATLDQLFGDVPLEHEHLERFGYREETLGGRSHYVGRSDKGVGIIGPVRHRAKGLLNKGFRKTKKTALPVQERTMKIVINPEAVRRAAEEAARGVNATMEGLKTVDFSKLNLGPGQVIEAPEPKAGKFARLASWLSDTWYDEEWHKGARNTAWTVLMWSFTVFAIVTFGKGMLWLFTL